MSLLKTATLGCKVNQYETELVREGLRTIGFRDALPGEPADLCVINTCTVTAEGDAKSRRVVRRMARQNPHARIVIMGCYATRAPDELAALPRVAEVITDKRELPDWLGRWGVIDLPQGISRFAGRHRAYVKVQDGCLLRCTYCIIPQVRPVMSSRPVEEIVEEVQRLVAHGYREIVLTGIHLGHFGVDRNRARPRAEWTRLSDLLRRLVALPGDFRIRLSSIEATEVTSELIEVMADHPQRICPHLHICLQSGSDEILRRMNRRWGVQRFIDRCRLVQERLPQPALTTDVIVGFPGENKRDFAETCRAAELCGFSKIHAFPFSPRRGTAAAAMAAQVSQQVKDERMARLAALERQLRQQYFRSLLGRRLRVLVEASLPDQPGQVTGTSCRYAPVRIPGSEALVGQLLEVIPVALQQGTLVAAVVTHRQSSILGHD